MDKIVKGGEYIGVTHVENGQYFSLLGSVYDAKSKEGKAMQKIDQALYNYHFESQEKYDQFGNKMTVSLPGTDFDMGEYTRTSALNLIEDTYFSFDSEGGQVVIFKLPKGVESKAKFEGFNNITKGKVSGNKSNTSSSIKNGITIGFERQNTSGTRVPNAAIIVFPTLSSANTFYDKWKSIMKGRVK